MGYLGGFAVTLRQMFQRRVSYEYPEEKRPVPARRHGRHVLNRYEDGMEKCIGCELCAGVCPARCIYVRGADNDADEPTSPGERFGYIYEINYLRCIHCDLCVEACPTEAITESKLFEFSFTNRPDAIYTKAELVVGDDGKPQHLPWEDWADGEDLLTSGWMRATASAGDVDYEGRILWSGELGYGVRPPERGQADGAGPFQQDVGAATGLLGAEAHDHAADDPHGGAHEHHGRHDHGPSMAGHGEEAIEHAAAAAGEEAHELAHGTDR